MAEKTHVTGGLETVGNLLKSDFQYHVPLHQRDFSWSKDEVKQMWDDFMDAIDGDHEEYFLGTMVVTEDDLSTVREVIDGQQRLATLLMIVAGIRSAYEEREDDRSGEIAAEFLGPKDRLTRETEPKLKMNSVNAEVFGAYVIEHVSLEDVKKAREDKALRRSNQLLLDASRFIREQINERADAAAKYVSFLVDLETFIMKRVKVILVVAGDDSDAYLIFETLNDRGLDLSVSDLLKNYVYGKAGADFDTVRRRWEEILVLIPAQDVPQFLRHYWLSNFAVVREKALYKALKRNIRNAPEGAGPDERSRCRR